jgi:hypothetical protein
MCHNANNFGESMQLQHIQINLNDVRVFAIPDTTPNSIWGCFVMMLHDFKEIKLPRIQNCQSLQGRLYLPEFSILHPKIHALEIEHLFSKNPHIFHPEFGLFELQTPLDWSEVLEIPLAGSNEIIAPCRTPEYPSTILKIEVKAIPPEELLKNLEQKVVPKKRSFKDEALNGKEKIRYNLLKSIFKPSKENKGKGIRIKDWFKPVAYGMRSFLPKGKEQLQNMAQDFEDLEKRNESEMNKLLNMLKNNPEEALKYAIPIDFNGTSRGGNAGLFKLGRQWGVFNLFGSNRNYGGGSGYISLKDEAVARLQNQYNESAKNFIADNKYDKAAFIYLKLLNNPYLAAKTLEDGQLYPEAASVYLKSVNSKHKAAECYEKGRMTTEAINLYKELAMHEKVGDLYTGLSNEKEANVHYNYVVVNYKEDHKYLKASMILRSKMKNPAAAQELLLTGWLENRDPFNCINNYFNAIEEETELMQEIERIYKNHTDDDNITLFLKALRFEFKKSDALAKQTKEIAYQIISEQAAYHPKIVSELTAFNKDGMITKDIMRFKR